MLTYTLAGGCFWCLDAVFKNVKGVKGVVAGYTGGSKEDANYESVSAGNTMHAESVQITFDQSVISEDIVLDIFFLIHDPTTKDKQGADVGHQYRSVMFYKDLEQKDKFIKAIERAQKNWKNKIVTDLEKLTVFYPAEDYHQDYFNKNPENSYCSIVISPKILKLKKEYSKYLKEEG